ncbi:MAG: hypothetical protein MZV63_12195 [Marinilabiliales bacterium]|nr:hypothetical protein [Marinilabiliales bacterium]
MADTARAANRRAGEAAAIHGLVSDASDCVLASPARHRQHPRSWRGIGESRPPGRAATRCTPRRTRRRHRIPSGRWTGRGGVWFQGEPLRDHATAVVEEISD